MLYVTLSLTNIKGFFEKLLLEAWSTANEFQETARRVCGIMSLGHEVRNEFSC